jgi:tetratricopeptide (TPR) repeat protein
MPKKKITEAVTSNDSATKRWKATFAAARMAYQTGEFHQAESLIHRAIEGAKGLPEKTFAVNASEIGSAAILLATKRSKEAAKQLERNIANLNGQPDHSHKELLAVAMRFHAQALADMGDERGAEKELIESAAILSGLGQDASVQLAYTLSDLCGIYLVQGRVSEVEQHIMKVMKILSDVLGPDSPDYTRADMIYQLSLPMEGDSRVDYASDGISRMEYAFGDKHPNIARALGRYFALLKERGHTDKIEDTKKRFGNAFASQK